jgi:hypothetical protein
MHPVAPSTVMSINCAENFERIEARDKGHAVVLF